MGAYLQITPALHSKLGYGEVRGCYYGPTGRTDHRTVTSAEGETFACEIDHFDAEKDPFPYPGEYFSTVLCGELIEHRPRAEDFFRPCQQFLNVLAHGHAADRNSRRVPAGQPQGSQLVPTG